MGITERGTRCSQAPLFHLELSVWHVYRHIGVSGGLFVNALLRETAQLQRSTWGRIPICSWRRPGGSGWR